MQCPICETIVRDGAQFCTHCGLQLCAPEVVHQEYPAIDAQVIDVHARPTAESPVANIEPASADEAFAFDYPDEIEPPQSGDARLQSGQYPQPRASEPSIVVDDRFGDLPAVDDAFEFADVEYIEPRRPVLRDPGPVSYEIGEDIGAFLENETPDLFGAPDEEEHTFRVSEAQAPAELEAMLAQLKDEGDALHNERQESRRVSRDFNAITNPDVMFDDEIPVDEVSMSEAPDDDYVFGENSDFDDDGFSFGGENDEDSGPVPVHPERYRELTNPPTFEASSDSLPSPDMRARLDVILAKVKGVRSRFRGRRRQRDPQRQRQIVVTMMVALAIVGIGYAVIAGGGSDESASETTAFNPAEAISAASMAPTTGPETPATDSPEYELVRLSDVDALAPGETPETGDAVAAAPARSHKKAWEQNQISGDVKSEKYTLKRSCILRAGPASRFEQVSPLNPGDEVKIYAKSSEDWNTATIGNVSGWTKDCEGESCVLRMGPGKQFRTAEIGDHTPKPTRRVISSGRWKYIEANGQYGWSGPACFK